MSKYANTWINYADSDGLRDGWQTTNQERADAQFMDGQAPVCKCGKAFEWRPTCGCYVCPQCGEIENG